MRGRSTASTAVDESVTLATLPPFRAVEPGEMVATVKIIPFAVPGAVLDAVLAKRPARAACARPFRPLRVGVVSTMLPGLKPSVVAKTLRVLADRLAPGRGHRSRPRSACRMSRRPWPRRCARFAPACDMTIVYGASAIADRRDVIPAAIEAAGGTVQHLGMPVDPGNLLLLGTLAGKPVLGRSRLRPQPEGERLRLGAAAAAGRDSRSRRDDIRRLGTGGLLMEIVSRPQPREGEPSRPAPITAAEPVA